MTENVDLSIIIINRNTKDLLKGCLSSLRQDSTMPRVEIWVVDNASDDGSVSMIQTEFLEVNLIANQENMGFAHANNQALAHSSGRYCFLLNPDTVVLPGTLDHLLRFMEDTPQAGVAGCAQVYPDGQRQVTCHRAITLTREALIAFGLSFIFRRLIDYTEFTTPERVDWVEGGALLIRETALAAVDGLDESFFMYAEDADLCYRVRQAGFEIYYVPNVQIIHYRGQSTGLEQREGWQKHVSTELLLEFHRSKAYYIRKHFGNWRAVAYRILVCVYSLRKLTMGLGLYLLRLMGWEEWDQVASAYLALLRTDWNGKSDI